MSTAELIITNARALTLDPERPRAEAVAVRGERILFVGSERSALELRGPQTTVFDAEGKTLLPGLIDSHFHLLWGSLRLGDIQLEEVGDLDALRRAVEDYRRAHPGAAWLRGAGLGYEVLPGGARLTRRHLDALERDTPLVLTCFDFHTLWCNTAALQRAGILHGAEVASNAEVVMGEEGLATGELREFEAMRLVYDLMPEPGESEVLERLREGVRLANSYGITSIHNMNGDREEFALYRRLERSGELPLRIYFPFHLRPEMPISVIEDEALELREGYRSPYLRAGMLKLFMDGVVEAYTAFLSEPYAGADHCGEAIFEAEHFNEIAVRAERAGLQVAVHAIGDAAVRRALDGFEVARRVNGKEGSRHRLEHVELLHPDDLGRFAELGVIASVQPYHCTRPETGHLTAWMRFVPPHRLRDSFPWQTLRAAGARLAFGSDWPVVTMNPFLSFEAAQRRRPWGAGQPDQAQTLLDTLAGYTKDAAYAEFQESEKGQLKAGMLADLVLLSDDLEPLETFSGLRAVLTVSGGRVVHQD